MSFAIKIWTMVFFVICFSNPVYAGGGHVHFGRSEFVNGGMTPVQISASIAEIGRNIQLAQELLAAGDLSKIEGIANDIRDISGHLVENAGMNRARHANLKRASKDILKAADRLKKFADEENISQAQEQVERIQKLINFLA